VQIRVHRRPRDASVVGTQREFGSLGTHLADLVLAFNALVMVSIVHFACAVGLASRRGWEFLRLFFRKGF